MTREEYELWRRYIEAQCSITLGDDKRYFLESRLARLVAEYGKQGFGDLYRYASRSIDPAFRDRILDVVTINETLWFRDAAAWEALRDHILPEMVFRDGGTRQGHLRIWSAACSTGQEPYSVAMLVDEFCQGLRPPNLDPTRFEILATDISPSALFLAMAGRYDEAAMRRGLTGAYQRFRGRYFERKDQISEIRADLRRRVVFQRFNLRDDLATLGTFDLVLLRYVAIYFSASFRRGLFRRIARAMRPGGCLLLGGAEPPFDGMGDFEPLRAGRTYYFQKKEPT